MKWQRAAFLPPLILSLTVACSRRPNVLTANQSPADSQQLSFEASPAKGGVSPTGSLAVLSLPPGTSLSVRLQSALSSATSHAGDSFDAVVDEPVIVEGQSVVPRGTRTAGKVVAAKASTGPQDAGYLRLMLTDISIGGKSLTLQTSSVFAKGSLRDGPGTELVDTATGHTGDRRDVSFPAQWRVAFRLTEHLTLSE